MPATPPLSLNDLPAGAHATVTAVQAAGPEVSAALLRRLGEIGFVPGEKVHLLRRGPGGREPLAVQVGDTFFALRAAEARCIQVSAAEVRCTQVSAAEARCIQVSAAEARCTQVIAAEARGVQVSATDTALAPQPATAPHG